MKKAVIIAEPAGRSGIFPVKRKNRSQWSALFAIKDPRKADYRSLFTIYAARTIPGSVVWPSTITY